ncbi:hypothetical protein P8452_42228 [Trifolium repens]|nr:hypothetical protein QL285_026613 [Trifolium repens]WJX56581.1 hypothetical protein P8452_42228 [Trifolium repens]
MANFSIPWKFLDVEAAPTISIKEPVQKVKTFAQALTNLCDIPSSQLQQPVVKGDRLAIEIPDEAYNAGLDACKNNLHGRIIWPKGTTPLTVVALKQKLSMIWKDLSKWGVISLGKGFYEFTFSSLEDVKRVRSVPSWNLNPGLLKLFAWSRDFNPKMQQNTSARVWVRIYGLAQEYWQKAILFTIAGSLGTPICMDSITAKPMYERTFGQYARVLIDIDISQPLRHKVLVERKGYAFFVELDYEHIPEFCSHCRIIGHHVNNCKRINKDMEQRTVKDVSTAKKHIGDTSKTWIPTMNNENQSTQEANIVNKDADGRHVGNHTSQKENSPSQVNLVSPDADTLIDQIPDNNIVTRNEGTVLSPVLAIQEAPSVEELNDTSSETSSHGTFVDATQHQLIIHENVVINKDIPTPERVQQDMNFLKESWANMVAEDDDNTINSIENVGNNDGFQVVQNRVQKRAQKKQSQASRETYTTRSKVPSKPFK